MIYLKLTTFTQIIEKMTNTTWVAKILL